MEVTREELLTRVTMSDASKIEFITNGITCGEVHPITASKFVISIQNTYHFAKGDIQKLFKISGTKYYAFASIMRIPNDILDECIKYDEWKLSSLYSLSRMGKINMEATYKKKHNKWEQERTSSQSIPITTSEHETMVRVIENPEIPCIGAFNNQQQKHETKPITIRDLSELPSVVQEISKQVSNTTATLDRAKIISTPSTSKATQSGALLASSIKELIYILNNNPTVPLHQVRTVFADLSTLQGLINHILK